MKTHYTEITGTDEQIKQFLFNIGKPVDTIIEESENILKLWPDPLFFNIVLFDFGNAVQDLYKKLYGETLNSHSFSSKSRRTMYLAVKGMNMRTFAHEAAHMIINIFVTEKLSRECHEQLAQWVETEI